MGERLQEIMARGIHKADENLGALPWEEQSASVKAAQIQRADCALRALRAAGVRHIVLEPAVQQPDRSACDG